MNKYLIGATAGFVATAAMTAAMGAMFKRLPREQRYPLPPREITTALTRRAGLAEHLSERQHRHAALASHFAFGAAAGALYAPVAIRSGFPPAAGGIGYGLLIWAGSYLGWVPALGILRPATEWPAERNALMVAAHVVWGLVTGLMVDRSAVRPGGGGGGIREPTADGQFEASSGRSRSASPRGPTERRT